MQTEIINIGDELLIGQVINTNASWMSDHLGLAGFPGSQGYRDRMIRSKSLTL